MVSYLDVFLRCAGYLHAPGFFTHQFAQPRGVFSRVLRWRHVVKSDQKQAAAPQRTWSGMFPNVAAGIEALGSPWQRSRPADQQAPEAPSQPTRR